LTAADKDALIAAADTRRRNWRHARIQDLWQRPYEYCLPMITVWFATLCD
jgi:hypothetical protein